MNRLRSTDAPYSIVRCSALDLTVSRNCLPFETRNRAEIAAHWQTAQAENPALFNGKIFMATGVSVNEQSMRASCHATNFATLMYWRTQRNTLNTRNIFANLVLRSSDNALVMGRMAPHTSIAGKTCYPGGSLDASDIRDGQVDATACALRECLEETGIAPGEYTLNPGFIVCWDDRMIAISRVADLKVDAETARRQIQRFMDSEAEPEFDDIIIVRSPSDAVRVIPDRYERELAEYLFHEAQA